MNSQPRRMWKENVIANFSPVSVYWDWMKPHKYPVPFHWSLFEAGNSRLRTSHVTARQVLYLGFCSILRRLFVVRAEDISVVLFAFMNCLECPVVTAQLAGWAFKHYTELQSAWRGHCVAHLGTSKKGNAALKNVYALLGVHSYLQSL